MAVLAQEHPEGASDGTSNCMFRLRTARSATAPESDALRTPVRSLQGVFRGRPRGLPDLRMPRESCHWQRFSESCGGVKRIVSQRGIRQVQPEQNGCMAVQFGLAGPALASEKGQRFCFCSASVIGAENTDVSANSLSISVAFSIAGQPKSQSSRTTSPFYQHAASAVIGLAAQTR